jgi:hypothetical protein
MDYQGSRLPYVDFSCLSFLPQHFYKGSDAKFKVFTALFAEEHSWMRYCVIGQVVPHSSKDSTAIIFKGQVVLNHLPSNTAFFPRRLHFSKGFIEFLTPDDKTAIRIHSSYWLFMVKVL